MGNRENGQDGFGKWLRQKRRALDLTQEAFADQVGCARITLRRIESDALKPSKELALLLLESGYPTARARSLAPLCPWIR
ncbi:MAG: helix-turn-helix transcriptional regulator [Anaerolineales bacterium]|nr:helix-turn-helix transcriptional regulator [Anaerolineales bacterium]